MRFYLTPSKRLRTFLLMALCVVPVLSATGHAETLQLTEAKIIELALEKNLGVKIAQTDSQISETGIQGSKSRFDTLLELDADYLLDQGDRSLVVFGFDNRTSNWNLGVSKLLPSGTQARFEWRNQRNSTDSLFTELNPFYDSTLAFAIEQPLLKNMFGKQDRGEVKIAKKAYESVDSLSQRRVSEAVFQVLFDYWRWHTNRAVVVVTRRSVEEAKKFEDISKQKEEFGLHESTDVLASKANRLEIENVLRNAKKRRADSLGRLRRGLNLGEGPTIRSSEQVPFSTEKPNLDQALSIALQHRSDYLAAKSTLDARKIELALAKNRKWPELDLIASLEINGVEEGYGNALSTMTSADHPAVFVGGQFLFPIENRFAKSEKRRAELEKARTIYEMKDLENRITQDVEEQWRDVIRWMENVLSNRRIEKLQHDKWQEEFKKYRTGRSSSDIVVRYQEDYLNAQRITLNALFQYHMSVLALRLAQNTLIP